MPTNLSFLLVIFVLVVEQTWSFATRTTTANPLGVLSTKQNWNRQNHHHAGSTTVSISPGIISSSLQGMMHPEDPWDHDGDDFDVEAERQKLESLVGGGGGQQQHQQQQTDPSSLPATSFPQKGQQNQQQQQRQQLMSSYDSSAFWERIQLPRAPPLTSIDRERRQAEIALLGQLKNDDDSIQDIWNLWLQERGPEAGARLLAANDLVNNPATWNQAEEALQALIAEYGVHWAEPVVRLATLYYQQGKLRKAEKLCRTVLAVKPWHFGALSGIVVVYAALHAVNEARHGAAHRLPTFAPTGPNRRRQQWVIKAVSQAEAALEAAEQRLQQGFGAMDDHILEKNRFVVMKEDDEVADSSSSLDADAWQ